MQAGSIQLKVWPKSLSWFFGTVALNECILPSKTQGEREERDFYCSTGWALRSLALLEHLGQSKYDTPCSLPNPSRESCSAVRLCNLFLSLLPRKALQPIKERMTKWFLDIYRSCLCLKQLSVCDTCEVRAVCTEVGAGWENRQVFAGVTVGKDSERKWCRNVEMLRDHFTSCGHLQQRLAVSLGALFFCVLRKTCMALCYHRAASTVSYLIRITHPSDHTPER